MRALLVIADIGGYTKFLTVHRINLTHAQEVIARLLEAVIDAARPLTLAKLEGDAAFFYLKLPDAPKEGEFQVLSEVVPRIREAFLTARADLDINRVCTCEGCVQAGSLTLKFVAHHGEVALQKVKRLTELAGVDVIHVHRLLKNSVPIREYALMSDTLGEHLDGALKPHALPITESLEGIGDVAAVYVDLTRVPTPELSVVRSRVRAWLNWLRMTWRGLPYLLGLKKPCEGFQNLEGMVEPTPRLPASVPDGASK